MGNNISACLCFFGFILILGTGHGFCLLQEECFCVDNYSNSLCDHWNCSEVFRHDFGVCNNHGDCVAYDDCNCYNDTIYYGNNCEWDCYGLPRLNSNSCRYGTCVDYNDCLCEKTSCGNNKICVYGYRCSERIFNGYFISHLIMRIQWEVEYIDLENYQGVIQITSSSIIVECSSVLENTNSILGNLDNAVCSFLTTGSTSTFLEVSLDYTHNILNNSVILVNTITDENKVNVTIVSNFPNCGICLNGFCSSMTNCTCNDGWKGKYCNITICTVDCGNGICSPFVPNECSCENGWDGDYCDEPVCEPECISPSTCLSPPNNCSSIVIDDDSNDDDSDNPDLTFLVFIPIVFVVICIVVFIFMIVVGVLFCYFKKKKDGKYIEMNVEMDSIRKDENENVVEKEDPKEQERKVEEMKLRLQKVKEVLNEQSDDDNDGGESLGEIEREKIEDNIQNEDLGDGELEKGGESDNDDQYSDVDSDREHIDRDIEEEVSDVEEEDSRSEYLGVKEVDVGRLSDIPKPIFNEEKKKPIIEIDEINPKESKKKKKKFSIFKMLKKEKKIEKKEKNDNLLDLGRPLKIVMVGDGNVGKTSIFVVYTTGSFPEDYLPTIFENYKKNLKIEQGEIELFLVDTAGQEDYAQLRKLSYSETDIFILCYSVDNLTSFQNIKKMWLPEVKEFSKKKRIMLLATKTDLRNDPETLKDKTIKIISREDGEKYKKELNFGSFMECSAKANEGISEIFVKAVKLYFNLD